MGWEKVMLTGFLLFGLAALLRLPGLGNTFQSSDNAELAARIVKFQGWSWMLEERYGLLINVVVKCFTASIHALGIRLTEFWWKLPIALVGSLQAPLTYIVMRRMRATESGAFFGGAIFAVFPLHIMQSRYLWGYEVLGLFCLTLVILALIRLFSDPEPKHKLFAAATLSLYLTSHGYILPLIPCLVVASLLFARGTSLAQRLHNAAFQNKSYVVWIIPLLLFPVYLSPLQHALTKPTDLGFYALDHLTEFIGNLGWPLLTFMVTGFCSGLLGLIFTFWKAASRPREDGKKQSGDVKGKRLLAINGSIPEGKRSVFFWMCGAIYLAPLFLLTPPGITVIRGYMLIGTSLALMGAIFTLDITIGFDRLFTVFGTTLVILLTAWATTNTIWQPENPPYPLGLKPERGCVDRNPGTKAAGFLIQKYIPEDCSVLALHKAVEPPNLIYYFRRTRRAFYDLDMQTRQKYLEKHIGAADVVVCGSELHRMMDSNPDFPNRTVLLSGKNARMWIYSRETIQLPQSAFQIGTLNKKWDKKCSRTVSFW